MVALPGLTWEYIAFNIDIHRLSELTYAWKLRPHANDTLKAIENMVEQWGGFERRKKKKLRKDEGLFELVSFDPSKWKSVGSRKL